LQLNAQKYVLSDYIMGCKLGFSHHPSHVETL